MQLGFHLDIIMVVGIHKGALSVLIGLYTPPPPPPNAKVLATPLVCVFGKFL